MAVILVEIGCTLEKCMLFSLTGSEMLQFSNLKSTVQECQRKQNEKSPQWDQGIALQQGTPHKELRKELTIQNPQFF